MDWTAEQQEAINAIMAKERLAFEAKMKKQQEEMKAKLDEALAHKGTTQDLQAKLQELTSTLMTKEELAKQNEEKLRKSLEETANQAKESQAQWRKQYETLLVNKELTAAASKANAWDADQLITLLGGNTKVIEKTDDQGKPTGEFQVVVAVRSGDKVLELEPEKALEQLRSDKRYANQFKATNVPGLGNSNVTLNNLPGGGSGDRSIPTDTEAYMAKRASLKEQGLI